MINNFHHETDFYDAFSLNKRKQELKSHIMKQNAFNKVLTQHNDSLNVSNIKVNSPPQKILEL